MLSYSTTHLFHTDYIDYGTFDNQHHTLGSFDSRLNLGDRLGVGLGDDEADTVLGGAAVDALGLPDIGVRPAGVGTGDDLHRVIDLVCSSRHIKNPP